MRACLLFLILSLPVAVAEAVTFRAEIDEASWQMETSEFVCRLRQAIPSYGTASFEHQAGESVRFVLKPTQQQQVTAAKPPPPAEPSSRSRA